MDNSLERKLLRDIEEPKDFNETCIHMIDIFNDVRDKKYSKEQLLELRNIIHNMDAVIYQELDFVDCEKSSGLDTSKKHNIYRVIYRNNPRYSKLTDE